MKKDWIIFYIFLIIMTMTTGCYGFKNGEVDSVINYLKENKLIKSDWILIADYNPGRGENDLPEHNLFIRQMIYSIL